MPVNTQIEIKCVLLVDDDMADRQLVKLALAKSSQSIQFDIDTMFIDTMFLFKIQNT